MQAADVKKTLSLFNHNQHKMMPVRSLPLDFPKARLHLPPSAPTFTVGLTLAVERATVLTLIDF